MLESNKVAWFTAFIAVNNVLSISFNLGGPYYAIMGLVLIIALYKGGINRNVGFPMLLLYLACILSIVGNEIPSFFHPWLRFGTFFLLTLLLTPFIKSDYLIELRRQTFEHMLFLLEIVVILSVIAFAIGMGRGRGGFVGVTNQAMLMSPIAAMVMLRAVHRLKNHLYDNVKQRIYNIVLLVFSIACWLLPASRISVAAGVIAMVVYFIAINDFRFDKTAKALLLILVALGATYSVWNPLLSNLEEKNASSIRAGGLLNSREQYWEQRVTEFESSPVIGIGFASLSLSEYSTIDVSTGGVESGSSWLSILSMTGVFGMMAFLTILGFTFRKLWALKEVSLAHFSYMLYLLVFFLVHMTAEGYIFGAGGFLFFSFWILIGSIDAYYELLTE